MCRSCSGTFPEDRTTWSSPSPNRESETEQEAKFALRSWAEDRAAFRACSSPRGEAFLKAFLPCIPRISKRSNNLEVGSVGGFRSSFVRVVIYASQHFIVLLNRV